MIVFVLHDARMKARAAALDRFAVLVEPRVAQAGKTRHHPAHAGHRQAALPALLEVIAQRRQGRIDQNGLRHRLGLGVARVVLDAENHDLQPDADLRRRESGAVERRHRIAHVGEQRVQLGGVEFRHRLRAFEQTRVAHSQYISNRHWLPPVRVCVAPCPVACRITAAMSSIAKCRRALSPRPAA